MKRDEVCMNWRWSKDEVKMKGRWSISENEV